MEVLNRTKLERTETNQVERFSPCFNLKSAWHPFTLSSVNFKTPIDNIVQNISSFVFIKYTLFLVHEGLKKGAWASWKYTIIYVNIG